MLMSKQDRCAIYETLFMDGVLTAKKDYFADSHPDVEGVRNLHVIKACQSLTSRGYVKEQFAWRHYYWYLTNEGVNYLREFLHLPSDVVPNTLKKKAPVAGAGRVQRVGGGRREDRSDRDNYRRQGDDEKKAGPGSDFQPSF
eukprot:Awhi_evm1s13006